jgi:hypothetical protein
MSATIVRATYGDVRTRVDVTTILAKRVEELKMVGAVGLTSGGGVHGFAPQLFGDDPTPGRAKHLECTVRYASGQETMWKVREYGCRWAETRQLVFAEVGEAIQGNVEVVIAPKKETKAAESKETIVEPTDRKDGPEKTIVAGSTSDILELKSGGGNETKEPGVSEANLPPFDTELDLPIDDQVAFTDIKIWSLSDGSVYSFPCPRCGGGVTIPCDGGGINCGIFRHFISRDSRTPTNPHAPMEECRRLVRGGLVEGCGKPFAFNGTVVKKCDYKLPSFR